jgi:hypothetical protein
MFTRFRRNLAYHNLKYLTVQEIKTYVRDRQDMDNLNNSYKSLFDRMMKIYKDI